MGSLWAPNIPYYGPMMGPNMDPLRAPFGPHYGTQYGSIIGPTMDPEWLLLLLLLLLLLPHYGPMQGIVVSHVFGKRANAYQSSACIPKTKLKQTNWTKNGETASQRR
jgi:hypothetical protein